MASYALPESRSAAFNAGSNHAKVDFTTPGFNRPKDNPQPVCGHAVCEPGEKCNFQVRTPGRSETRYDWTQ